MVKGLLLLKIFIILPFILSCVSRDTPLTEPVLHQDFPIKSIEKPINIKKAHNSILIKDITMIYSSKGEVDARVEGLIEKNNNVVALKAKISEIYDLFLKGDYNNSLSNIKEVISADNNLYILYHMAGVMLSKMGNYKSAMWNIEQAEIASKEYGDTEWYSISLINRGSICYLKKEIDKAMEYYRQGIKEAGALPQIKANGLIDLGVIYLDRWELDNALDSSSASLEISRQIQDKEVELLSLLNISKVYFDREEYQNVFNREPFEDSIKHSTEAIQLAKALGYKRQEAELINLFGYISLEGGVIEDARRFFEKALEISKETRYKIGKIKSLIGLGTIFSARDRVETAMEYYNNALGISRETGYKLGEAETLLGVGNVYYVKKEFDKALDYYLKALELRNDINNLKLTSSILTSLATSYYEKGELDNALRYYSEALVINSKIQYKSGEMNNLTYIGLIHKKKGEYDIAMNFSLKVIEYAEDKLKFRREKGISMNNIGNIYMEIGRPQEAERYFLRSIELSKVVGDILTTIDNMTNIGIILQREGASDKALKFFTDALELSKRIGTRKYIIDNLKNIGDYYRFEKKESEANRYYDEANEYKQR